jgi:FAD:protein FMN transferase
VSASTGSPPTAPVLERELGAASWRALGTHVDLRTTPEALDRAVALATAVLDEVDASCSRFRDDSDLSRANRHAGRAVPASPVLVGALCVALEAAQETGGVVDPTLGGLLVAAGYDRTFGLVPGDDASPVSLPVARGRWEDVRVGPATVTVPAGAALDLGATGKAFAADLVALSVAEECGEPVLVSVGGDVRVLPAGGRAPDHPVVIGHSVADLARGGDRAVVTVREGGIATSSTSARRWRRAGLQWHHIIDPRTGAPAHGPLRTVTALGHTAAAANTATTAAVVLGADAWDWLVAHDVAARLVDHDGHVTRTPAWTASGIEEDA